jgi:flagellar protein FliJ
MPKFVFQLDAVLRHRKMLEDERMRELGVAQTEMAKLQAELRAMDETTQTVSDDVRTNRLTGTLDMAFLAAHRRYVLAMQRKALALAQRMAAQQQVVDAARAKLAEAAKQRKIIEKLKERQQERWRAEQSRKELESLGEVNMQLALEPYFAVADDATSGGGGARP